MIINIKVKTIILNVVLLVVVVFNH